MKNKLVFRTAKLLSDARKVRQDSGVAIAYEFQPKDQDEKNHGSLFAVIEIEGPTNSCQEIVELIVDVLHEEYYRDLDKDALESFEATLSKINEELADITDQGKIHWLGKLNAVLGVIQDKTVHLTQAGNAEAYLFRKDIMSNITKGLAGDNINPLRTFINIASGELQEDDRLGFFTPGIFFHLSKDELKKYVTKFNPNIAISHLAELLEGLNGQRRSSALIIEVLTPDALANFTLDDAPEEVWVQETKKGVEAITKGVTPIILTYARKSANIFTIVLGFITASLIPAISSFFSTFTKNVSSLFSKQSPETQDIFIQPKDAFSESRIDGELDELQENTESDSSEGGEEDIPAGNQISITEKPERKSLVYSTFNNFSGGMKKKTSNALKLPKGNHIKTVIIVVLAVLLLLVAFTSISGRIKGKRVANLKNTYEEAVAKYDEGSNKLVTNEKEKALSLFAESKNLAEKAKKTKKYEKDAEALLNKIKEKEESLLGITYYNGDAFSDLDKLKATGLLGLQKVGDNFYAINSNTGSAYEISKDGEAKEIIREFEFKGKPISAVGIEDTEKIVILTDEPALYELDVKKKEIFSVRVSGDLSKGNDIGAFGSNIYILNSEDGSIDKHTKVVGGYGRSSSYIQKADSSNIKSAISMAIDGNIYILSSDDRITKYTQGVQKDFELKDLPEKLLGSLKIFSIDGTKGLYVLNKEKKNITVFNENNVFVKQIKSDKFNDLKGIYVGDDKVIYALAGTKIYKISQ